MRYMARKGIENWMVWDRKARKPATIDDRPAVKLSESEAKERAAELNGEREPKLAKSDEPSMPRPRRP
jgi:hypothetical protein